jgi:hypothetical protein
MLPLRWTQNNSPLPCGPHRGNRPPSAEIFSRRLCLAHQRRRLQTISAGLARHAPPQFAAVHRAPKGIWGLRAASSPCRASTSPVTWCVWPGMPQSYAFFAVCQFWDRFPASVGEEGDTWPG